MNATAHYQLFLTFAKERYEGCTLQQKLEMYLSHHPARAVALLRELILAHYYTDWNEEDLTNDERSD
jgi:hypothetical protein